MATTGRGAGLQSAWLRKVRNPKGAFPNLYPSGPQWTDTAKAVWGDWAFEAASGGAQTLTPTLFADADTFGAAVVSQASGPQTLTPTLFTDGETFGTAVIGRGAVTLTATRYDDPDTFGAATVGRGAVTLTATRYDDPDLFGAAVVTSGIVTLTGYVADGYWLDGYVEEGVPTARPRGDDAGVSTRSSGARERFWRERAEEWLEDRLERIEEVAREPKRTRRNFADNVLERAEAWPVLAPRVDALAALMASLTVAQPDYTALAMQVAEWRAQIAAERRKRRQSRDIEALMALGEI